MKQSNSFLKDILTLSAVPMISQVVGFFLTPIVTRLYGPEAFGVANTFGSLIGVIVVFATMGYHNSLILPKEHKSAFNMLVVCFTSVIGITLLSVIGIAISKNFIVQEMKTPELQNYLWLVPLFVLLHGIYQTLRFWNVRFKKFGKIASSRVAEVGGQKGVVLSLGFLGHTTGGSLILGTLIASIVKNLILIQGVWKENSKVFFNNLSWSTLIEGAKRYRKFPMFSVWSELLSRMPALITVFLFLKYFNQTILGYYSLSLMVLTLPTTLITSSIMEAFSPRAAMAKHDGTHVILLIKVYERIVSLTFFLFMILAIFGDTLFNFVFGADWIEAGVIAQILVIRCFFEIVFTPVLSFINIMAKQEISLIRRVSSIIIVTTALIIGGTSENYYLAILLLALLDSALITAVGSYMMYILKFPMLQMIKKLSFYLIICFSIGIILIIVRYSESNTSIIVKLLIIGISTIVYYSSVLYHDKDMRAAFVSIATKIVPFIK
jgi:lipopolysaccharide exporter